VKEELERRQRVRNSPRVGNAWLTKYWYAPARLSRMTQWKVPSRAVNATSMKSGPEEAIEAEVQFRSEAAPSGKQNVELARGLV